MMLTVLTLSYCNNDYITYTDPITNLVWTRCSLTADGKVDTTYECSASSGKFLWEDALDICENLNYDNNKYEWRLPNIRELHSILAVYRSTYPLIDENIFPGVDISPGSPISSVYWSSTTYNARSIDADPADKDNYALTVDFVYGTVYPTNKIENINFVRCVAGP